MERLNDLQRVAIECYALSVSTAGQYAVEADAEKAAELRASLMALEKQLRAATTPDELQTIAASYRGELREYRDQAHKRLEQLRKDVAAAADAMKSIAESVATAGEDHQDTVNKELQGLRGLTQSANLAEIRSGIRSATTGIASSIDQMQRSNQMVVAQLQDEIRLLHQQIQTERRVLQTDQASGAWNRQKVEVRISELVNQDEPFCLMVVGLRNIRQVARQNSQNTVEAALKAVLGRFQGMIGGDGMIGRWNDEQFVAVLTIRPQDAIEMSREVTQKLSGDYTIQNNGISLTVQLQAVAGIVDRRSGTDATKLRKQLDQIIDALAQP